MAADEDNPKGVRLRQDFPELVEGPGGSRIPGPGPSWHVAPHGPRLHLTSELQQECRRDPLLVPRRVALRHRADQPAEVRGHPGAAARGRPPPPEQPEPLPVPPEERLRLHDHQRIPPSEAPRQEYQPHPNRIACSSRPDLPFALERQPLGKSRLWSVTYNVLLAITS
jgi:hypothetical protein